MTEQEAEAWVLRLKRIWKLGDVETWYRPGHALTVLCHLCDDVRFRGDLAPHVVVFSLLGDKYALQFMENQIFVVPHDEEVQAQQWSLPYQAMFRCNCWLSGANIEATAHEKAEWIQGFTREEIDAWNLKM